MAVPGISGLLAPYAARGIKLDSFELDDFIEALQLRGTNIGLCAYVLGNQSSIATFAYGGARFIQTNGNLNLNTGLTLRCVAVIGGGAFVVTLPPAADVPAGDIIRVLVADAATGALVRRAGSDTIDGGAADVSLTTGSPLGLLRSDGVSAWTTL